MNYKYYFNIGNFFMKISNLSWTPTIQNISFYLLQWEPLKSLRNVSYFMLKALFLIEIFKFLCWLFGHVEKQPNKKAVVNFKIYDVTDWTTNNENTHSW